MDALHQARRGGLAASESGWALQHALLSHLERIWTRARRRHLGGARRAPALHLFQGDGLGRVRPRDQERRAVRARRARSTLARGARRDPRRRLPATASTASSAASCSPTARSSSTRACCCCRASASCPPTIRASAARSRRSSAACWSTASSCATTPRRPTTACRRAKARSSPAASGWSMPMSCSGRFADARRLFDRLLALRNDVGLLSEEYDPRARPAGRQFPAGLLPRRAGQQRVQPDATEKPAEQRAAPATEDAAPPIAAEA